MRTKDEILKHIDDFYKETPNTCDRLLVSLNMVVEVLADIRDALITDCKDAMNALIEIRKTK